MDRVHPTISFVCVPTIMCSSTGSETERALEPCARAAFRLHLSTRIYALNRYRTDNVQPVACDLLAERRICDLVDARAEEAYAPPNQAAICWQAGKQEQGSQN